MIKGVKKPGKSDKKEPVTVQKTPQSVKKPAKKAGKKRMKNRSKKQAKTMRILRKIYPVYLEAHPLCGIRSPVCANVATEVNHDKGRGANTLNQEDWTPCCNPCNLYIEVHHEWARERGFKKRRHGKKECQ